LERAYSGSGKGSGRGRDSSQYRLFRKGYGDDRFSFLAFLGFKNVLHSPHPIYGGDLPIEKEISFFKEEKYVS